MPLPSLGRMWIMSKRYPPEQRARAVKMLLDHLAEYRSVYAACQAIGPKVGVGVEPPPSTPCSAPPRGEALSPADLDTRSASPGVVSALPGSPPGSGEVAGA